MKRRIALVLSVCVIILCAAQAVAGNILPAETELISNAHLREGPSSESKSKMILMKGSKITVHEVLGQWLLVRYGNFTGYIRDDLVRSSASYSPFGVPLAPTMPPSQLGIRSTLSEGTRSSEVKALQDALIRLGYTEIVADGLYGELTRLKVMEFQRDMGLPVDGVVGQTTADALDSAIAYVSGMDSNLMK